MWVDSLISSDRKRIDMVHGVIILLVGVAQPHIPLGGRSRKKRILQGPLSRCSNALCGFESDGDIVLAQRLLLAPLAL